MNEQTPVVNNDASRMLCIKTNKGCFISDCFYTDGYKYEYHYTEISKLLFNGKKATATYCKNWYYIEEYPTLIQIEAEGKCINERYEIRNTSLISDNLPAIISCEDAINYDSDIINGLYAYKYDREPTYLKEVTYDILVICEIANYNFAPEIKYAGVHKVNFSTEKYTITNANVQHQMLDKIIFPEIMLHNTPCKFTSKQMYDITRQYIVEHIDNSVAKITSDYDFCFTVRKIIPKIEPETITYTNVFAKTKRERNKIHTKIQTYEEKTIFSMTSDKEQYTGYPIIPEMCANSETELKEKVDLWLGNLIKLINEPVCQCPQCKGLGYVNKISEIPFDYK